jgi:DDE superfamily endonuclease
MEDGLEVYAEPYEPTRPQGNVDGTTTQLRKETRPPLPAQAGRPQRSDDEYERNGTRHLFLCVEPPAGRRHGQVTEQRPQRDLAQAMQGRVDEGDPEATVMRGVLDNLKTPQLASLYETFELAEARRIARQRALHETPKHGSWLHRAEIAFSVLQHQCLERRIPDEATLTRAMAAWEHQRNTEQATIAWRFSVSEARNKLKRLYPSLPS